MKFEIENYNSNLLLNELIELNIGINCFDHVDGGIEINCIDVTGAIKEQIQTAIDNHNPDDWEEPKTEFEKMQETIDYLVVASLEG
jgi:hypothetical protein